MTASHTSAAVLQGFVVRSPRDDEAKLIRSYFAVRDEDADKHQILGAFGSPGDVPLGAVVVRPTGKGHSAIFQILVHPEARRRGIGRRLMHHLYELALANRAQRLVLGQLVHQDLPENAFCRAVGLTPETELATYVLHLERDVLRICEPIVRRFARSVSLDMRIVPFDDCEPPKIADFVARNYTGSAEFTHRQLTEGYFDSTLSIAAIHAGQIVAVSLYRSRPDEPSVFLDLTLVAPEFRHRSLSILLTAENARRALAAGKTHIVFEADEAHDPFAVGFARRCGVAGGHKRYRYTIDAAGMQAAIAAGVR